ncbi:Mur ligase family protein [Carnobacterium inhibens]|uniref:UDP-N-acetylmuramoylalanyl-D-glutamate--2, 6-diaminopimelate ligase n=2 Tax=Carnobacterium inhibens TaxID=147709 RepID=U5S9M0_9LACT|nr:UDP-N-acetylmuramyl-tripeptide synthetase [Carnobacterium inhibens]AGY81731.1 UDP-N-acetylmuramoylalanyl-D-glutamate--2,6-diaminopimelate ligase [Carnobacterium inhibens subsp. gilichinskyi]MBC9824888.1 UDP-N-acetylmuramyl-tripeptide synthetase [Carnobacterium inhibens]
MKLTDLLKSVEIDSSRHNQLETALDKIEIKKITYHSKEVKADTLFVCIKGQQTDGHNYAKHAVSQGATVIIVEQFIEDLDTLQLKVSDSRETLAVLSSNFFDHPSKSMSLFGVTATNGKTTITYMTEEIFKAYQLKSGLIGTILVKIDKEIEMSLLTTPESYDLQQYFAKMRDREITHVSMEVSSSALELKRVYNTDFDVVAFTNISPEHIKLHESFDAYFDAKASLIRNASKMSTAVLNLDEPLLIPLEEETEAQVVTFGIENKTGTITASDIRFSSGIPSFKVTICKPFNTLSGKRIETTSFDLELSIPGYHSIYNALTALVTGLVNDIPIEDVQRGIKNFRGVERRFQILYDKEFKVIDDLLLNQNNIDSCMETISHLDYNELHLVHAIRGSNGPAHSTEIAETLAKWFHKMKVAEIILTTASSHVDKKDEVTDEELAAFLKVMKLNKIEVTFFKELEDALRLSVEQLNAEDILLISGAHSMDQGARKTLELLKEIHPNVDYEMIDQVLENKLIGLNSLKAAEKIKNYNLGV